MDRCDIHGVRGEKPLYERLMALPGQAILTVVALPVLAPILVGRGVKRMAAAMRSRRAARANRARVETETAPGRVHARLVHV
jgi:hypothetical protein